MHIICNNIKDFCELINISVGQDLKEKTIFISSKLGYPSVATAITPKNYKSFTFVLFTSLYTAIYSGNIKSDIFDIEYDLLKDTCSKHKIYIHSFDELKYNSNNNSLSLETHIDVI